MSLATVVGAIVAYPVNVWLVATGMKHGMGTVRALGKGGHTLAVEREYRRSALGEVLPTNAIPSAVATTRGTSGA